MPFAARCPGHIAPGSRAERTALTMDIFATASANNNSSATDKYRGKSGRNDADVAANVRSRRREEADQASWLCVRLPTYGPAGVASASSWGVSPRVETGGETPPELAGETPAVPRPRAARVPRPTPVRWPHGAPSFGAAVLLTSAVPVSHSL